MRVNASVALLNDTSWTSLFYWLKEILLTLFFMVFCNSVCCERVADATPEKAIFSKRLKYEKEFPRNILRSIVKQCSIRRDNNINRTLRAVSAKYNQINGEYQETRKVVSL